MAGIAGFHSSAAVITDPSKIKKESQKRAKINREEYAPKAAEFVKKHPDCQIKGPECTGASQCVHHKKGKNSTEDLLDEKFWMSVCFRCNLTVEQNDLWARQNGFKLSRLSPKKKTA
jgi:hypothetical protein